MTTMKKTILAAAFLLFSVCALAVVPEKKTVKEFLRMSSKDTTLCELTGVVERVRNYSKGNLYLSDGTGTVLIYGVYSRDRRSFTDLDVRDGDTLTVSGRRFVYNGNVIEMKNAWYVSHTEGPDHQNVLKTDKLDKNPTFKGKDVNEFSKWVSAHLKYPESAKDAYMDGTVLVSFIVGMDGSILEPTILQGVHPALDAEVLRVLSKSPKWKPGMVDNHTVRVTYTMPVVFVIPQ